MIRVRFRFKLSGKVRRRLAAASLTAAVLALIVWTAAPYCIDDPMPRIRLSTPARIYTDRTGQPVFYERTCRYEWRFPVKLEDVSPKAVEIMLAAEDFDFYKHGGVDYTSVLRAIWQDVKNFHIVSGASTISMQLAGFALPNHNRSLIRKFKQAVYARKLEMLYSKDRILTEYLNRIPCGGKLYGIEAASLFYFGLHASQLNAAEAAVICGIPQKPNKFCPDKYPEAAKKRQKIVLRLLVHHGLITEAEEKRIYNEEPLRYRDFSTPADFEVKAIPDEAIHAVRRSRFEMLKQPQIPSETLPVVCSIDAELQHDVRDILSRRRNTMPGVHDAAAVMLDNESGEVLVFLGTLNFADPDNGQVNAADAVRSAGSTLKPFIYAEAIEGGFLSADTKLLDAPLRYGSYAPGNFDKTFRGIVKASYALPHSLNTPAIRLAAKLGERRMITLAQKLDILPDVLPRSDFGLSMALGSAGHTLIDLTNAYRVLASGGRLRPVFFLHDKNRPSDSGRFVFSPGTCEMISSMLTGLPLAESSIKAAWKTGTSNNLRDAWCFAYTDRITLGIWFGNKSGMESDRLVGGTSAGPAAGEIITLAESKYHLAVSDDAWPSDEHLEFTDLCAASGLAAAPDCAKITTGRKAAGIPLTVCTDCAAADETSFRILSPAPHNYISEDGKPLLLELDAGEGVQWFVDGQFRGEVKDRIPFAIGRHSVQAVRMDDSKLDSVEFSVSARK